MNSDTPVTAFVLSYQRGAYLREMILSLLAQSKRPDHIIILDNASKPDVKAAIADLLGPQVSWHSNDQTGTPDQNFERAFTMVKTPYFYLLHDDDRTLPDFVARGCSFLDGHPNLVAVGCNALKINSKGDRIDGGPLFKLESSATLLASGFEAARFYSHRFIPFPTILYRNSPKFPLPPRRIGTFGKVWDVSFLIELAEMYAIAYIPEPLFEYRVHAGQDSMSFPEDAVRNLENYLIKMASKSPTALAHVAPLIFYKRMRRLASRLIKRSFN